MSAKNRAIGNTEDEFQAALATYTKAGNKTAAMRRLWNAAYEIGRTAAETAAVFGVEEVKVEPVKEKKSKRVEEARTMGFAEGRQAGFEEGRDSALTMDTFQVSFEAGKMDGVATGMEQGREAEEKRWTDAGHFANGTCRPFDIPIIPPIPSAQSLETKTQIPGTFDWAEDAEFLPIHTVLPAVQQPRDFSALRSDARNPFDTLQRRHARYRGTRTRSRRPPRKQVYCANIRPDLPQLTRRNLTLAPCAKAKPVGDKNPSVWMVFMWIWAMLRTRGASG